MPSTKRQYRAILIPDTVLAEDVESLADTGQLPTEQIEAPSAEQAMRMAAQLSGLRVLKADRVEVA